MGDLTLTTFDWVPKSPRGYARDLRVRWALEEAGLPYRVESVPVRDRNADYATYANRQTLSLEDQADFLYCIRGLIDEDSMLNNDERFVDFLKLVSKSDGKVRALEMCAGPCNGIAVGFRQNKPDPKMAANIAQALLKVPLTKDERTISNAQRPLNFSFAQFTGPSSSVRGRRPVPPG